MLLHGPALLVVFAVYGVLAVSGEEEARGCKTEDGKEVRAGEQHDVPGHCHLHQCKANGEWLIAACGSLGVPQGWSATPEDTSEGAKYPACCAHLVAPQDLVPDVLDTLPGTYYVGVSYGDVAATVGNELTPTQVKAEPTVNLTYWAEPQSHYLLIMTDPDAPSRQNPESREFLHWMVGNIPGDQVGSGEVIAEYVGSGPPQGTGLHRYFFLMFEQPGKLTFDEPKIVKTSVGWRRKFSTRKFAKKYGLGIPKAVNVYQAQYDDYVPEVHKLLGFTAPKSN